MKKLKNRKLLSKIRNYLFDDEIIVIHGSRQVGKTSLLELIISNELKQKVENNNIFYFDLEDFSLLDLCNSTIENILGYLKNKGANFDKKVFLIIDEIQYLNNPSSFLKLLYDRYKGKIKVIVSGSSSMQIKEKFKNSLVGRTINFELFTLDFEEFLDFKEKKYNLGEVSTIDLINNELKELYKEFIIYGSYPAIVLEDELEKKEVKIKQIINTYIKKDIRDLADIRQPEKFNSLVKILASQVGGLVNTFELSKTLGLSKETIEKYIFLLENTYILKLIRPFHANLRNELTKMPKVFFEDTGLANILANKIFFTEVNGSLLENSIYNQLRKALPVENVFFWRTNNKQEIDFIIDYLNKNKKKQIYAIEVKNIFLNKNIKTLLYFNNIYKNSKNIYCCLEIKEQKKQEDILVLYPWNIPYVLDILSS